MSDANRLFVESIYARNADHFRSNEAIGLLKNIPRTFEHGWTYLFELLQNALDCRATKVSYTQARESIHFQHDGNHFKRKHVEGLSKVGLSTKLSAIGFMGIGFKSVFARFHHVKIAAKGWTFHFDVTDQIGDYQESIPNDVGMVLPIWDERATPPDHSYTTRFHLQRPWGNGTFESDLKKLVDQVHADALVPLALQGLRSLTLPSQEWQLCVKSNSRGRVVTATTENKVLNWQCFETNFTPSTKAIKAFLEHRKIAITDGNREQIRKEVTRPRTVVAFLQIDNKGNPKFAKPHGQVFAVLPADDRIPLGLNLQADWLLNLSRTGIVDPDGCEWQSEILNCVPRLIRQYLEWFAECDVAELQRTIGYGGLPDTQMDSDERPIVKWFWNDQFKTLLQHELRDSAVFPYRNDEAKIAFGKAPDLRILPIPLEQEFAKHTDFYPKILFGTHSIAQDLIGKRGFRFALWLDLIPVLTASDVASRWEKGLDFWLKAFERETPLLPMSDVVTQPQQSLQSTRARFSKTQRDALAVLYSGLQELEHCPDWSGRVLAVIPTVSGDWKDRLSVKRLEGFDVIRKDKVLWSFLGSNLPVGSDLALDNLFPTGSTSTESHLAASHFVNAIEPITLTTAIKGWWATIGNDSLNAETIDGIVRLTTVAANSKRLSIVERLLVDVNGEVVLLSPSKTYIGVPYVSQPQADARASLFHDCQKISSIYAESRPSDMLNQSFVSLFETIKANGPLVLSCSHHDRSVGEANRILNSPLPFPPNQNAIVLDYTWESSIKNYACSTYGRRHLLNWIGQEAIDTTKINATAIKKVGKGQHSGQGHATWVRELMLWEWIPVDDRFLAPPNVLLERDLGRPLAPIASVSENIRKNIALLKLPFGTKLTASTSNAIGSLSGNQIAASFFEELRLLLQTNPNCIRAFTELLDIASNNRGDEKVLNRLICEHFAVPKTVGPDLDGNGGKSEQGEHHRDRDANESGDVRASKTPSGGCDERTNRLEREESTDHLQTAQNWLRVKTGPNDDSENSSEPSVIRNDQRAREAVRRFEKAQGRKPSETHLPPNQPGFDVESTDPKRGTLRRIEIKGVGKKWDGVATVTVSLTQFNHGRGDHSPELEYWLYVVDGLETDRPRIFAFRDAMRKVQHFYFQANDWKERADETMEIEFPFETQP